MSLGSCIITTGSHGVATPTPTLARNGNRIIRDAFTSSRAALFSCRGEYDMIV